MKREVAGGVPVVAGFFWKLCTRDLILVQKQI